VGVTECRIAWVGLGEQKEIKIVPEWAGWIREQKDKKCGSVGVGWLREQ
jgi:hypothetical protein